MDAVTIQPSNIHVSTRLIVLVQDATANKAHFHELYKQKLSDSNLNLEH